MRNKPDFFPAIAFFCVAVSCLAHGAADWFFGLSAIAVAMAVGTTFDRGL